MKKFISAIVVLLAISTSNEVNAQKFPGLDKSPADIVLHSRRASEKILKIVYSRPQLRGRSLDKLAPNDKIWRTGANEATQITFYEDVVFGGKNVKAGTYSLFTIPGEQEWTIILNSATNEWGAYSYKKDKDVVRIKAPVSKTDKTIEAFSMTVEKDMLYLGWANTIVGVSLK
ncbi:MAG: DUF2911 domain-containing protein [Flavobacteriaceae bacterium]|nr:MAG: DUF2911 domain-containing protein [Flavobacteriaceae bacterium]